jgi:hypothetical protein
MSPAERFEEAASLLARGILRHRLSQGSIGRERHVSDSTLTQIAQLNKLSFSELQARWRSLLGTEPPAYHRRFLVKRLAYRIQELAYGGLSEATRAQMADILQDAGLDEQASIPGRGRTQKRTQDLPLAGTRLVREWNGRRCQVTVVSGGFVFEGRLEALALGPRKAVALLLAGAPSHGKPEPPGVECRLL